MPLLNIAFWFLAGMIVGWFLATTPDSDRDYIAQSITKNQSKQNIARIQSATTEGNEIANVPIEDYNETDIIVIEQFEESLQEDQKQAVIIYQQEVRTGNDIAQQMRNRLIARIVALMRSNQYEEAQQLITAYLDSNAYDTEVLVLQARLYQIVGRHLEALGNAYDAKIYGDQSVEGQAIDELITEILDEYEQQLTEKRDWDALATLYGLVVEKDYSELQSSYYYKLAHAQFKLSDYYTALASVSQIVGHPLWNRKALYLQNNIEKFIEGEGIVAIPIELTEPHKYIIIATINDTIEAELLIDTGASLSVLREKFVDDVELPIKDEEPLTLTTASDTVEARTIKLDSFGIGDVKFADMAIGVTKMPDDFLPDGLLGMDYLSEFQFNLDQEALTLYLYSL
ncbi:MAG: clan AA aspartic protease [Chromatiales bacterium]|nr:clan AA aspartic protease [Chromatiales bacterium]